MATIARIAVKDKLVTSNELDKLRTELNRIPNIAQHHLQMHNRVNLAEGRFLITDFLVDVDECLEKQVKLAITESGFQLRGGALFQQQSVRKAVKALVLQHFQHAENPPEYAIWFDLSSSSNVHILEISGKTYDPGDGSLMGISMGAAGVVPKAKFIVMYLSSPKELRRAFRLNPTHPAVVALKDGDFYIIHRSKKSADFLGRFPSLEIASAQAEP